jgi:hypothetical protein
VGFSSITFGIQTSEEWRLYNNTPTSSQQSPMSTA